MAGNNSNDDPAWILLILIVIFAGIGWLVWYFFGTSILEVVRYVKLVEIAPFAVVDHRAAACMHWLSTAKVGDNVPTQEAYQAAIGCFGPGLARLSASEAMAYYNVTATSMGVVAHFIASYAKWFVIAFCCFVAYYASFRSIRNKYKTRHNLESFIREQAKIWKVISPIVDFNPAKHNARILGGPVPAKLPPFAEALAPEEWLAFHRIPIASGVPSREAVHRALAWQLGPRWRGDFQDMPFHMQALCAAFALKGVQRREESDDLLGEISACWTIGGGLSYSPEMKGRIRKLLSDPAVGGEALKIANRHAYRTTAILGILKWARFMGGVLAAAQFLWLRGADRNLWYALNNLGRRSFFAEGAGALAHFMAEDLAHAPLAVPRFETAIVTINKYVGDNQIVLPPYEEQKGRA